MWGVGSKGGREVVVSWAVRVTVVVIAVMVVDGDGELVVMEVSVYVSRWSGMFCSISSSSFNNSSIF